jgi:hypothetical protein
MLSENFVKIMNHYSVHIALILLLITLFEDLYVFLHA